MLSKGTTFPSLMSIPSFDYFHGKIIHEPLDFTINESTNGDSEVSSEEKLPSEKNLEPQTSEDLELKKYTSCPSELQIQALRKKLNALDEQDPFEVIMSPIKKPVYKNFERYHTVSVPTIPEEEPSNFKLSPKKAQTLNGPQFEAKLEKSNSHKKEIQELIEFSESKRPCERKSVGGQSAHESIGMFKTFKMKDLKEFLEAKSKS